MKMEKEFDLHKKAVKKAEKNYPEAFKDYPKEFNLSKKMDKWVKPIDKEIRDVKEFIKRLKEEIPQFLEGDNFYKWEDTDFHGVIDKLAGFGKGANE